MGLDVLRILRAEILSKSANPDVGEIQGGDEGELHLENRMTVMV